MPRRPEHPPMMFVTCPRTGDRFAPGAVEFENIEEDWQGRDVVTFACPDCGVVHKSLVVVIGTNSTGPR